VVCVFETAHGPFVMTLVGATIVGSMATVWHGVVNPPACHVREWQYDDQKIVLKKAMSWAASCSAPPSSCCSRKMYWLQSGMAAGSRRATGRETMANCR
jgi:phosphatidylserine decarboxylase